MRVLLQRVSRAEVTVDDKSIAAIQQGLLLFVGITHADTEASGSYLAEKIVNLRIFEDEEGRMNRSLLDIKGSLLVVSQFTLYGNCSKGRRPGFDDAARPESAGPLFDRFVEHVSGYGLPVATGIFGADMNVSLVNDGPVTLMLEK